MIDSLRSSCIRIVWHQVGTNMVSVLERGASGVLGLPCPIVAITYKVKVAGQRTLYISVHDHEQPAEIFLRVKGSDCSSELIRLYYVIARLMSLALQYGVRLRRSTNSSQAPSLPRAASSWGMIASSTARVCRI